MYTPDRIARAGCRIMMWRYSIYLLYWYTSTNTDAKGAARLSHNDVAVFVVGSLLRLLLLYWYKGTDTDAAGAAGCRIMMWRSLLSVLCVFHFRGAK
jgi:hypothetical protein